MIKKLFGVLSPTGQALVMFTLAVIAYVIDTLHGAGGNVLQAVAIGAGALTYADWAKRLDPDGKVDKIVNILSQTNEILDDMLVVEGNLPTGHRTTVRTGLPQATWRLLNYGVAPTKSTTAQITDTCGMLETYSEIDIALANLNGNTNEFRLSEDQAFLEGMNQQMAGVLFYGNTGVNPERFMGLAPRYNTVTVANAQTANNVIDAGGVGATNTSMWCIVWGANTVHGIFPKGTKAGLQMRDLGEWTTTDANGNKYQVYRTHFKWDIGLTLRDWRYAVRIANIDVTQLSGGNAANLINALIRAVHRLPTAPSSASTEQKTDAPQDSGLMGQTVFYCNRVVRTYLDIQATNKTNVLLQMGQWHGMPVTTFRGIPIRTCDQILSTEARVV